MKVTQLSLLEPKEVYDVYRVCILVKMLKPNWQNGQAIQAFFLAHTKQSKVVNQLFKDRFGQLFIGIKSQNYKDQANAKNVIALYDANTTIHDYLKEYCADFVNIMNKRKEDFYAN